jgi:K+-transporting ATPase ATPase C chain
VARIAAARKAQPAEVLAVIAANTDGSTFGVLGEPRVNVLAANLALDARWPQPQR